MDREECEKQIRDLMIQIHDVYRKYNPKGKYLSMCINGDAVCANNAFFLGDEDRLLDMYYEIEQREE